MVPRRFIVLRFARPKRQTQHQTSQQPAAMMMRRLLFLLLGLSASPLFSAAFVIQPTAQQARSTTAHTAMFSTKATNKNTDRQPVNALDPAEEEAFLQRCKELCDARNLQLEKVKNARDLASVQNSPVLPGRLYRMGRVSDATDADIQLLLQELGIQTLVDLRSPTELKDDPTLLREAVFQNFTDIVWKEQGRRNGGCLRRLEKGEGPVRKRFWKRKQYSYEDYEEEVEVMENVTVISNGLISPEHPVAYDESDDQIFEQEEEEEECMSLDCPDEVSSPSRRERHFVSLMNEFKYVKGTVSKLRKRDITKSILKSPGAAVSRRMRASLKKPFLDSINDGGLPMLNELLLRFGAPGIKYVLELCADHNRHPIAFYCTAGKDRTGMIAAIILTLCGCQPDEIVEDYTLSANVYAEMNDHKAMVGALSQRNLDPKTFLGAPASVMRDTLKVVNDSYGSVEGYCDWIGFGPEQQEKLRRACMKPYSEIGARSELNYDI